MAPPSFAFDLMRTAVLGLAKKHPSLRSLINPRQTSAITYATSPLNAAPDRSAEFDAGPVPGAVLPECPITIADGSGTREGHLTDLLGPHFTALVFSDDGAVPAELEALDRALAAKQVPFKRVALTRRLGDCRAARLGPHRAPVPDVRRRARHAVSGAARWPCARTLAPSRRGRGAGGDRPRVEPQPTPGR